MKSAKTVEYKVARQIGGRRTPLSGSRSGITSGDTIHPTIYQETKSRKKYALFTLYDDVKQKAGKEKKVPVLVLHEHGTHDYLYVVEYQNIPKVAEAILKAKKENSKE